MVEKFLFFRKWNKKHIWDEGEDRACPQYSALRTMTMQYFFCYYRIFFGVETAGAKTPFESFKFFKIFYENRCIQIQCGDCYHFTHLVRWLPPPPKGRPSGGSVTKNLKNSMPAMPRIGPEPGVLRINGDLHGSGVNRIDLCLFSPDSEKVW